MSHAKDLGNLDRGGVLALAVNPLVAFWQSLVHFTSQLVHVLQKKPSEQWTAILRQPVIRKCLKNCRTREGIKKQNGYAAIRPIWKIMHTQVALEHTHLMA